MAFRLSSPLNRWLSRGYVNTPSPLLTKRVCLFIQPSPTDKMSAVPAPPIVQVEGDGSIHLLEPPAILRTSRSSALTAPTYFTPREYGLVKEPMESEERYSEHVEVFPPGADAGASDDESSTDNEGARADSLDVTGAARAEDDQEAYSDVETERVVKVSRARRNTTMTHKLDEYLGSALSCDHLKLGKKDRAEIKSLLDKKNIFKLPDAQRNWKKYIKHYGIGKSPSFHELIPTNVPMYLLLDPELMGVFNKDCVELKRMKELLPLSTDVIDYVAVYLKDGRTFVTASIEDDAEKELRLGWAEVMLTIDTTEMKEAANRRVVRVRDHVRILCLDVKKCMTCYALLKQPHPSIIHGNRNGTQIAVCENCSMIFHAGGAPGPDGDAVIKIRKKSDRSWVKVEVEDEAEDLDPEGKTDLEEPAPKKAVKPRKAAREAAKAETDDLSEEPALKKAVKPRKAASETEAETYTLSKEERLQGVSDVEKKLFSNDMKYNIAKKELEFFKGHLDDSIRPFTAKERQIILSTIGECVDDIHRMRTNAKELFEAVEALQPKKGPKKRTTNV